MQIHVHVNRGIGQVLTNMPPISTSSVFGGSTDLSDLPITTPDTSPGLIDTTGLTNGTSMTSCPNNTYPGTPADVNCPWYCPFTAFLPSACTPCTQQCPTGTVWDTTNNVCSSSPVTTNCVAGSAACPSYCNIPLIGSFFSACNQCPASTGSIMAGLGGLVMAAGLAYMGYKILSSKV